MNQASCFNFFSASIEKIPLPKRFTFPHCYEPHPLCLLAVEALQQQLTNISSLQSVFEQSGKMFGVLVVENSQGDIGYLSGFSGKGFSGSEKLNFVPSIFELNTQSSHNAFFHEENIIINRLNNELNELTQNPKRTEYQEAITLAVTQQNEQLEDHYTLMAKNRLQRKNARVQIKSTLQDNELAIALSQLAKESVHDKNSLRDLKTYWLNEIGSFQQPLSLIENELEAIKKTRKKLSTKLQKKLFKQYRLLNISGIEKDVIELFADSTFPIPPAGTGDCAAPKLLQYAFQQNLKPLAMAEFWWGKAPKSEIRQHKNFYPACSGKCQPLLAHMLEGLDVDENPLLVNPAENMVLDFIYQDDDLLVVNKPSGLLSVPGKNIDDSVYSRVKKQFPKADGSLIVHRLDMSTSGIMILALSKRAQKNLQHQFISRSIKKCYVATLEGDISDKFAVKGEITLPLRGDFEDRPRQLVCFEHGKQAKTQWKIIETINGRTKLFLFPETGRTHQLRVHCAHPDGLNMPIAGDDLYGSTEHGNKVHGSKNSITRLCLHAKTLELSHPITQENMSFHIDETF